MFTPCIITGLLSVIAFSANAGVVYSDFSDVSDLQLNGDTVQAGDHLRLLPAASDQSGSAFYTDTISLNNNASFSTAFNFETTESGGISYAGLANSLGVEFETYNNGSWDGHNGNHVGITADVGRPCPRQQWAVIATGSVTDCLIPALVNINTTPTTFPPISHYTYPLELDLLHGRIQPHV